MPTFGCYADVAMYPIGVTEHDKELYINESYELVKKSGLEYIIHEVGVTIEGSWDKVSEIVGQMHELVHKRGAVRIHSNMRVGSRIDKKQEASDKVNIVKEKLEVLMA